MNRMSRSRPRMHPNPLRPLAEGDLERVNAGWKEIRAAAKDLSAETGALLNSAARLLRARGAWCWDFPANCCAPKWRTANNQENARKSHQQVTGIDIQIDCRVAGKEENTIPDGVDRDGMVGTALSLAVRSRRTNNNAEVVMMKNMMGGNAGMMKQLKEMQEQLKRAQKELEKETVTGTAGGGAVEVVMTGAQKCTHITLDPAKVKDMKPENLQALVMLAVNDALDNSRKLMTKKLGPLSGGLGGLRLKKARHGNLT